MAKIGYARVSTQDQSLDSQIDTLKNFGCSKIFKEKVSGRKTKRSELDKCLEYLREGDTLVVYKLDRLGRTTKQLIELAQWLENNNIELQIIDMNINTKKGLASARARGRIGGRPPMPDHKKREIKFLYDEQKMTGEQIAEATGVSRSTVYRVVKDSKY